MFNLFKPKLVIVTHNGRFHPDDVFAVAVLELVFGNNKKIKIIRSRDSEIIKKADIVVDVGGEYNTDKNRFDHHQQDGAGKREDGIPYASFGLVWKKYGQALCGGKEIADEIEKSLVEPTDAGDSGVEIVTKKYGDIYPYEIFDVMDTFLPTWKENFDTDRAFEKAMIFAKKIIQREIILHKDRFEAVAKVTEIYKNTNDKRLLVLPGYYPFSRFVKNFPELLFVVFPDLDGQWSLNTVKIDKESFTDRKKLPVEWAGKFGADFEKVTGVTDAIFCHINRFVAKAKTKESILKLAEIALNSQN